MTEWLIIVTSGVHANILSFLSPSSLSLSLILEEAFKFTLGRRTGMVCGSVSQCASLNSLP